MKKDEEVEWWNDDYTPPKPATEPDPETIFKPKRKRPRLTFTGFKKGLALLLTIAYCFTVGTVVDSMLRPPSPLRPSYSPYLLLIVIPTIWILISYIKTASSKKEEQ